LHRILSDAVGFKDLLVITFLFVAFSVENVCVHLQQLIKQVHQVMYSDLIFFCRRLQN